MENYIERRSEVNTLGSHTGKWTIFEIGHYEFYGLDYNDNAVILINVHGKFIVGKKYPNCISIGGGYIVEHDTFEAAINEADNI